MTEPTSLVLFAGDITDENATLSLTSTVAFAAHNMGYAKHKETGLTGMGVLWASLAYAPITRAPDGGTCRTIPIPKPVRIADGDYLLKSVQTAAEAFSPGVYSGHMYLTLSSPRWAPCASTNDIFNPRKGACAAEFGLCNLRHMPKPQQPQQTITPSFVSRCIREFRAVFEC